MHCPFVVIFRRCSGLQFLQSPWYALLYSSLDVCLIIFVLKAQARRFGRHFDSGDATMGDTSPALKRRKVQRSFEAAHTWEVAEKEFGKSSVEFDSGSVRWAVRVGKSSGYSSYSPIFTLHFKSIGAVSGWGLFRVRFNHPQRASAHLHGVTVARLGDGDVEVVVSLKDPNQSIRQNKYLHEIEGSTRFQIALAVEVKPDGWQLGPVESLWETMERESVPFFCGWPCCLDSDSEGVSTTNVQAFKHPCSGAESEAEDSDPDGLRGLWRVTEDELHEISEDISRDIWRSEKNWREHMPKLESYAARRLLSGDVAGALALLSDHSETIGQEARQADNRVNSYVQQSFDGYIETDGSAAMWCQRLMALWGRVVCASQGNLHDAVFATFSGI